MVDNFSIIHAYIYRIIKTDYIQKKEISLNDLRVSINKVIYRMPNKLFYEFIKEMEELKLIKMQSQRTVLILLNKEADKKLNKIKDYFFW